MVALAVEARQAAFTLIELLVVIAIIAILAAVLLPVLHQAQLRGETAACIDHQKQLAAAWIMYAQDNNDGCAGNNWNNEQDWTVYRGQYSPAGTITQPTNWISGWMDPSGTSPNTKIPNGESDNTNDDLLVDPSYASLGDYVKNRRIFICPASEVKVEGSSGGGRIYNEIRSVSMNCWVGYTCDPPTGEQANYKEFNRLTAIVGGMDPVDLFVFMEERGESIDDGSFETQMHDNTIANWPTDYHNGAATVAFADGHVEVHRWFGEPGQYSCAAPQVPEPPTKWGTESVATKYLSDYDWLENHATCPIQ